MKRSLPLLLLGLILVAGCTGPGNVSDNPDSQPDSDTATITNTSWGTTELQDINTGDIFSIASFDKPVLVENFAVWCSTCLAQQNELKELHEGRDDFVSVVLNVDPNEDAQKVQQHIDQHGFDWRYAIAPPSMTQNMREEFGNSVLIPPRAPMILVCPDGSYERLEDGVKSVTKLEQEIDSCPV